ncbi:MAG TPA: hypothetical protein VFV41_17815 [Streptosporangiaceae bacterium]|nr:hypothetical protein [Streptosporangiaceae bacterium]
MPRRGADQGFGAPGDLPAGPDAGRRDMRPLHGSAFSPDAAPPGEWAFPGQSRDGRGPAGPWAGREPEVGGRTGRGYPPEPGQRGAGDWPRDGRDTGELRRDGRGFGPEPKTDAGGAADPGPTGGRRPGGWRKRAGLEAAAGALSGPAAPDYGYDLPARSPRRAEAGESAKPGKPEKSRRRGRGKRQQPPATGLLAADDVRADRAERGPADARRRPEPPGGPPLGQPGRGRAPGSGHVPPGPVSAGQVPPGPPPYGPAPRGPGPQRPVPLGAGSQRVVTPDQGPWDAVPGPQAGRAAFAAGTAQLVGQAMVPDTGALDVAGPDGARFAAAPPAARTAPARPAREGPAPAAPAPGKPAKKAQGKPAKKKAASKKAAGKKQVKAGPAAQRARQAAPAPARAGKAAGGRPKRRMARLAYLVVAGVAAAGVGAATVEFWPASSGPAHTITTPQRLGTYVQAPALAETMHAAQLRNGIVSQSGGQARNVVAVVYQSNSGPGGKSSPDIILFIGGNLSGSSASSFISSFAGRVPGAFSTAAGPIGGSAACVPGGSGRQAECAWADNDTFGLVASTTLDGQALANEMRQLRPQVEHRRS